MKKQSSPAINLTKNQLAIWLESKLHIDEPIFNIGSYIKLNAVPSFTILERAIIKVIEENDALRIQIIETRTSCEQVFRESVPFKLLSKNFQDSENSNEVALDWMRTEFLRGINVNDSSLYSFALVQYEEDKCYLFCKIHHIIIDGWSKDLFIRKIAEHYNALIESKSFSNSSSYASYVSNSLNSRSEREKEESLAFWIQKFEGFERNFLFRKKEMNLNYLPSSRKRMFMDRDKYDSIAFGDDSSSKSKFYFLIASLYVTLSRSSGQDEIVIGIPLLNRHNEIDKNTIGYYVGIMPLKLSFPRNCSFSELTQGIRDEMKSTFNYRNVAIHEINKTLGINFSNSSQLYDVVFSFQNQNYNCNFGDASILESGTFTTEYEQNPLVVKVQDSTANESITFSFEYNFNFLNEVEVNALIQRYQNTIDYYLNNAEASLVSSPILLYEEFQQLKKYSQGTCVEIESDNLAARIEKICSLHPDKIIVRDESCSLTGKELIHESKKLAAQLINDGIQVGDSVAIVLPRSVKHIVSLLGILMSGGCFVPIDSNLPQERKKNMLTQAKTKYIVYSSPEISLNDYPNFNSVDINKLSEDLVFNPPNIPIEHPVYIVFTSGTSGQPKGVQVSNNSISNLIAYLWDDVFSKQSEDSKLALLSSLNFDASMLHVFSSLIFGLELVIVPENTRKDGRLLLKFLIDNEIDVCDGIPTLIKMMIRRSGHAPNEFSVKQFILGGEVIQPEFIKQLFKWVGEKDLTVTNSYGPTETTVMSSYFTINKYNYEDYSDIPIGFPIQNTDLWIVDDNGQLLPPGVIGEIRIGGLGLSNGYINQKELTSEKFYMNKHLSQRLYATGDLGRWGEEGALFYHGRKDNQVKVRGYRIELTSIEHCLNEITGIEQSVVLVQKEANQDFLVGYIESSSVLKQSEVKQGLAKILPDYMIPNFIYSISEFPLTNTGKVDRKSLLKHTQKTKENNIKIANSLTEKKVSIIIAKVLGLNEVDTRISFFDLGGDSLGLVFVLAEIEVEFEVNISMSEFATLGNIVQISEFLDSNNEVLKKVVSIEDELNGLLKFEALSKERYLSDSKNAFITGANGFVGAFLVNELVSHFHKVYCLVRASDLNEAKDKLESSFSRYKISSSVMSSIEIILGDLSKPFLGLSKIDWNVLKGVSTIYHCGAEVNFVKDLDSLKKQNVLSTFELLKLCMLGAEKQFNYISTKGVFKSDEGQFNERSNIKTEVHFHDKGYPSSKWLSEVLLSKYLQYNLDINIYRLGRITGTGIKGIARSEDFFHRLIDGCILLNSIPKEILQNHFDMSPVDISAKGIFWLSKNENNGIFHISNNSLTSFNGFIVACEAHGIKLNVVNLETWLMSVDTLNNESRDNPLFLITPILKQGAWVANSRAIFDSDYTSSKMNKHHIKWPSNESLWSIYVRESLERKTSNSFLLKK